MSARQDRSMLEFYVGALTLLSLGFFAWMILFVDDIDPFGGSYPLYTDFAEVQLLQKGDAVRKNGLVIGKVDHFEFRGNLVRVRLLIDGQFQIRKDAEVAVGNVGLFGANYVKVSEPPLKEGEDDPGAWASGDVLDGNVAPDFESLLRGGNALLEDLRSTVQAVEALLNDEEIRENLVTTTREVRDAAAAGRRSLERLEQSADSILDDAEGAAAAARRLLEGEGGLDGALGKLDELLAEARDMAKENRTRILRTTEAVAEIVEDVRDRALAAHLSGAASEMEKFSRELRVFVEDLNKNGETPERIRRITDRVEAITTDLAAMTGTTRKAVESSNLEGNLRRAFDDVHTIASRVDEMGSALGQVRAEVVSSLFYSDGADDFRPDLNATLRLGSTGSVRLGVEDIGGRDDLNLQFGRPVLGGQARVGIIADEFGIGYDRYLFRRALQIRLEAYRPDDLLFRYAARFRIVDDTFLSLRVQDEAVGKQRVTYFGLERRF